MNNPQNIDELFRTAAENFRPEVSPLAWQEIEARIQKKRRKGLGWFWWTSAAVLVLAGGGWTFWLQNNRIKTHAIQYQAIQSQQIQEHNTAEDRRNKRFDGQTSEKAHPKDGEWSAKIESGTPNRKKESSKNAKDLTENTATSSLSKIKQSEKRNNIYRLQSSKKRVIAEEKHDFSTNYVSTISSSATKYTLNDGNRNKEFFESLNPLMSKNAPQLIAFWSRNISYKKDQPFSKKEINPKKQKSEIKRPQFAISFNPEYVNNWENLRPSYRSSINGTPAFIPVDSQFQNSLNSLSHYVGWSMSAQSRFILGTKTTFDVALSYTNRGDHQNYFDCFNPNTGETKKHYQPILGWQCSEATYNNSYHWITLPIGFTHAITGDVKSAGFRLQWNFIPTYLAGGSSMTYSFAQQDFLVAPVRTNSIYQKFGLNVGAGVVYAFKVGPKYLIETGLNWNGSWTTLFNDQYPVNKKFGATGAKIALIIK